MTTAQQQLIDHLNDAVAMEANVKTMVEGMISTTDDPNMRARFEMHREETIRQGERLTQCLEAHGESPSTVKATTAKAGAMMTGLFDSMRDEKLIKNARDAYATEHMEIAAYQVLERIAHLAGDEQAAEVARINREEEERMAEFLDGKWDLVTRLTMEAKVG